MAYASWSVVFGEQPSAAKWNILGTNDASFNDGTGLPNGIVLQVPSTNYTATATGTTQIPFDNTIPQNSEGDQYMTQTITPKSTTDRLNIEATVLVSHSANNVFMTLALFQDSTANALAATHFYGVAVATGGMNITLKHDMAAGTTSSTTFKIRIGAGSVGTTTFNGAGGISGPYGGVTISNIRIIEYKA